MKNMEVREKRIISATCETLRMDIWFSGGMKYSTFLNLMGFFSTSLWNLTYLWEFEDLKKVLINSAIFWGTAPCSSFANRRFEGISVHERSTWRYIPGDGRTECIYLRPIVLPFSWRGRIEATMDRPSEHKTWKDWGQIGGIIGVFYCSCCCRFNIQYSWYTYCSDTDNESLSHYSEKQ
jgi:hypothetical protein